MPAREIEGTVKIGDLLALTSLVIDVWLLLK